MQARVVLPQQIEVENHVEILEKREAEVYPVDFSGERVQFRPRQIIVCAGPPCNKDLAVL